MKSSIINLVKTQHGYSIIEGETQINKVAQAKQPKEKLYSAPKKFTQQTFTIYPYIYSKEKQNHKYLLIPAKAQWFNPALVHEIQKKALPQWFKIRKGMLATMNQTKFEKNEDLYKKYRNYMIDLGKDSYVSALRARKGLAGDVCSIIRIHSFLQRWGLINFVHQKPKQLIKKSQTSSNINLIELQNQNEPVQKRKDCFDKDKNTLSRNYNKDDLELIKKVTKKYRPLCHYCQGICGVSWYEYKQKMFVKELTQNVETHVNTVSSNLSFDYSIILCFHCFVEGNIPVILQTKDFSKVSVLQKIDQKLKDQNPKKKNNEFNKIADVIQKNRFNLKKSAETLKITEQNLFNSLMIMPLQKIEKMSRIQPETDEEDYQRHEQNNQFHIKDQKMKQQNQKNINQEEISCQKSNKAEIKDQNQVEDKLKDIFFSNVQALQYEEKQIYQKFLQAWLLKMYTKLQRLQTWDKVVNWNTERLQTIYKQNIVKKVKNSLKYQGQSRFSSQSQIQLAKSISKQRLQVEEQVNQVESIKKNSQNENNAQKRNQMLQNNQQNIQTISKQ